MSKKALLVIDYTYDFVADDGKLTCGKPGQAIEGAICGEIAKAVAAGEDIFCLLYTSEWHVWRSAFNRKPWLPDYRRRA